jgi:hypothetical protein
MGPIHSAATANVCFATRTSPIWNTWEVSGSGSKLPLGCFDSEPLLRPPNRRRPFPPCYPLISDILLQLLSTPTTSGPTPPLLRTTRLMRLGRVIEVAQVSSSGSKLPLGCFDSEPLLRPPNRRRPFPPCYPLISDILLQLLSTPTTSRPTPPLLRTTRLIRLGRVIEVAQVEVVHNLTALENVYNASLSPTVFSIPFINSIKLKNTHNPTTHNPTTQQPNNPQPNNPSPKHAFSRHLFQRPCIRVHGDCHHHASGHHICGLCTHRQRMPSGP